MEHTELIKNFERIRDCMRQFYVYGFRSHSEMNLKSARSYGCEFAGFFPRFSESGMVSYSHKDAVPPNGMARQEEHIISRGKRRQQNMAFSQLHPGDMVELGHYRQGENADVRPIQWQVLDTREGRALLLSRYVLDYQPFHHAAGAIRWEHSALRTWLLEKFVPEAFSRDELAQIYRSELPDDPMGDFLWEAFGMEDATEAERDPVFLLSHADILQYFPCENTMFCPGAAAEHTAWAAAQEPSGDVCWWMRSSAPDSPIAYIVSQAASIGIAFINPSNRQGVRPALWVKMDAQADPR